MESNCLVMVGRGLRTEPNLIGRGELPGSRPPTFEPWLTRDISRCFFFTVVKGKNIPTIKKNGGEKTKGKWERSYLPMFSAKFLCVCGVWGVGGLSRGNSSFACACLPYSNWSDGRGERSKNAWPCGKERLARWTWGWTEREREHAASLSVS